MLLDGSEMDSFADLTHTPQGDVKNEAMFSLLPKFKNLTHTPQGDVKAFPLITTWWSSRFNSPPARGRKPIPVDKDDNQAFGFNSHPARGHNRRAFSALHECGRKRLFCFFNFLRRFSNRARRQSLSLGVRQKHLKRKDKAYETSFGRTAAAANGPAHGGACGAGGAPARRPDAGRPQLLAVPHHAGGQRGQRQVYPDGTDPPPRAGPRRPRAGHRRHLCGQAGCAALPPPRRPGDLGLGHRPCQLLEPFPGAGCLRYAGTYPA